MFSHQLAEDGLEFFSDAAADEGHERFYEYRLM